MYKIIISELIVLKIQQKKRIITRRQFIKIKEIKDININDLSKKVIELKKIYKDFKYIINFEKQ
jgi:hypothetical protein